MLKSESLALSLLQARRQGVLHAALAIVGGALIALSARLSIPLPFSPVPITLQTAVILTLAGLLGRRSVWSVGVYLVAGALGLPVLAGNWGGLARFAGPTGGYLLGFALAAYVAGWLSEHSADQPLRLLLALLSGQALIYICGLAWLSHFVPTNRLLLAGLYPFLPGDACKLAMSFLLVAPARLAQDSSR